MPDLSIIIVNWNTRAMVLQCLDSIEKVRGSLDCEVIVVDNASSDGSPEAIEHDYPHARVIRNDNNLGFARANNAGIRLSTGRYVFLINSDVIVRPGCLQAMVDFMDRNPDVGLAGPRILNPDGTVQSTCQNFPTSRNMICEMLALPRMLPHVTFLRGLDMDEWTYDEMRDVDILYGCFWVARREALGKVGLLDETFFMYGEDMDWCRRFHQAGWRVVFHPGGEAVHYGGQSSARAPVKFYVELHRANLHYWRKHHGWPGWFYCLALSYLHQVLRIVPGMVLYLLKPASRTETSWKIRRSVACLTRLLRSIAL